MLYSIVNLGLGGVAVETFRNDRERERKNGARENLFLTRFTLRVRCKALLSFFFFLPGNIIKRALNFCGHVNKIEMEIA